MAQSARETFQSALQDVLIVLRNEFRTSNLAMSCSLRKVADDMV